jgi:hypothetical protein
MPSASWTVAPTRAILLSAATPPHQKGLFKMTLSQLVLFPLQHRVVSESWYEEMMRIASAPQPVPAPLKVKRVRTAKV